MALAFVKKDSAVSGINVTLLSTVAARSNFSRAVNFLIRFGELSSDDLQPRVGEPVTGPHSPRSAL